MGTTLSIFSPDLDQQKIHNLLRELCNDINNETDIRAAFVNQEGEQGTRGPIDLATITLTFLTGGGAVALINVLRSYVERGSKLAIKLEKDGKTLNIEAENVRASQITQTIEEANKFFA